MGGKVQGIRSINGRYKTERRRMLEEGGGAGQRGIKGRKKEWDNCNSIINKIYVLKRMQRAAIYFRIIYVCEHLHL